MTKPKEVGRSLPTPALAELREIELSKIEAFEAKDWPRNPRTIQPTEEEFEPLKNSIKAVGQKVPIRVRPHPDKPGKFQLADGAMRRRAVAELGKKTILAMVESLTNRQMKILSIVANTFIRLRDSDKEASVYKLWETEYKTEQPSSKGGPRDVEHTGLREMESETGMSRETVRGYLNAYEARVRIIHEAPREVKEATKAMSSKDMTAISSVAKESTKVAQQIVMARKDEDSPIKPRDVAEIVKAVKEAAPREKEKVAEQIIAAKRQEAKAVGEAKRAMEDRIAEIKADADSPEERKKRAETLRTTKDDAERREEMERLKKVAITKERLDADQLQTYIRLDQSTQVHTSEDIYERIVNVRNENVKKETVARIKSIAEKWTAFAARFK